MAAREDAAGGGSGDTNPVTGTAGSTNPGAAAPRAPPQPVQTAVLGSPAFPYYASPFPQHPAAALPYPTPSPYQTNFSATPASTRWSSKPVLARYSDHVLRSLAFIFGSVALVLISSSTAIQHKTGAGKSQQGGNLNLLNESAFIYLFVIGIIASLYSAAQLSKCIWEISFKCSLMPSGKTADYFTAVADMVLSYLLLSSTSVAVHDLCIRGNSYIHVDIRPRAWGSVAMSFFALAVVSISSFLSGYKLCKRIIW